MNRNKMSVYLPVLSLLLFLVLSFLRCSSVENNPIAPGAESGSRELIATAPGGGFALDEDDLIRTNPGEWLDESDVTINDRFRNRSEGDLWVEIPDPGVFVFDFGPHGEKFRIPLRIDISIRKADIEEFQKRKIGVWYVDGKQPQPVPYMVNPRKGVVSFWVKHFSRYALSRE